MKIKILLWMLLSSIQLLNAQSDSLTVYLFPGQGGDYRLFDSLQLDPDYRIRHIAYPRPERGMSLPEYAHLLSTQIDTTERFALVGVSLGGMFATEIHTRLNPERTILISSAKARTELPGRYRIQRFLKIYRIVPGRVSLFFAKILQPLVEPDRRHQAATFKAMLRDKDPKFLHRTIRMMLEWERRDVPPDIVHIHGPKDHTIPIRNVRYDVLVENGSHMIVLTRGAEVSTLVNQHLK